MEKPMPSQASSAPLAVRTTRARSVEDGPLLRLRLLRAAAMRMAPVSKTCWRPTIAHIRRLWQFAPEIDEAAVRRPLAPAACGAEIVVLLRRIPRRCDNKIET